MKKETAWVFALFVATSLGLLALIVLTSSCSQSMRGQYEEKKEKAHNNPLYYAPEIE